MASLSSFYVPFEATPTIDINYRQLPPLPWRKLPSEVLGKILYFLDPLRDWLTLAQSGDPFRALLYNGIYHVECITLRIDHSISNDWLKQIIEAYSSRVTEVSLLETGSISRRLWPVITTLDNLETLCLRDLPALPIGAFSKVTRFEYKQAIPPDTWQSLTSFIESLPNLNVLHLMANISGTPSASSWIDRPLQELHVDAWCFQPEINKQLYDDIVKCINKSQLTLTTFSYSNQVCGDTDALMGALSACKALRRLSLSSVGTLLEAIVELGNDGSSNLEHLSLNCTAVIGDGGSFAKWLEGCQRLKSLSLYMYRGDPQLVLAVVTPALKKLVSLQYLSIEGFDMPAEGWWTVAESLPRLKGVSLWGTAPPGLFDAHPQFLVSWSHQYEPSSASLETALREILPQPSRKVVKPRRPAPPNLLSWLPIETIDLVTSFLPLVPDILNLQCICQRYSNLASRMSYALEDVALPGNVRSCSHFQRVMAIISAHVKRLACGSEGVTNPLVWSAVSTGLPPMPKLEHLELFELPDRLSTTRLKFPPAFSSFKYAGTNPINWDTLSRFIRAVPSLSSLELQGVALGAPGDSRWLSKDGGWRKLVIGVTLQDARQGIIVGNSSRRQRAVGDLCDSVSSALEASKSTLMEFGFKEVCTRGMLDALRGCQSLVKLQLTINRQRASELVPLPGYDTLRSLRLAFPLPDDTTRRERAMMDRSVDDVVSSLSAYQSLRHIALDGCNTPLELSHVSMNALGGLMLESLELRDVLVILGELEELEGLALRTLRHFTITGPLREKPDTYRLLRESCPKLRTLTVSLSDFTPGPVVYDEIRLLRSSSGVRVL
ncbi:hypothetical protein FOL47_006901 [Perkinsus chesapeaki]|uniref:F-box domain-containing protein n=1 Tax=Perkinsus chesapeaki TaxID=330153 RepID=A0A7J6LPJ1_PERCH|nr:hypothetical protein FOL47_006901 [Perkinsus chesapeaki]